MSNVLQIVRFAIGLTMVAAGGLLTAPFVTAVVDSARQSPAGVQLQKGLPQTSRQGRSAGVYAVPGGHRGLPAFDPVAGDQQPALVSAVPSETGPKQIGSPARLPPVQQASRPPGMNQAYRSTVEVPPPPLLDEAALPAARHQVQQLPTALRRFEPQNIPETYRVQDGDDLTAIASRLYGHPRGAAAIWRANRDRLESPDLLPIGMPLVVPPAWQVFGGDQAWSSGPRQIEPNQSADAAQTVGGVVPVGWQEPATGAADLPAGLKPWLGQATGSAAVTAARPAAPASRGSLRVASGDTLESIARRVYGDARMADQLFAANREQLGSPELLVPGMELRLP